jgi:hypothetical protein
MAGASTTLATDDKLKKKGCLNGFSDIFTLFQVINVHLQS